MSSNDVEIILCRIRIVNRDILLNCQLQIGGVRFHCVVIFPNSLAGDDVLYDFEI